MKTLSFCCLLLLPFVLPQKPDCVQLEVIKSNELRGIKGASGLYFYKDKLYMITERCREIIETDLKGNKKRLIALKGMPADATTLEGITVVNGSFMLIDEERPSIYEVDMDGNFRKEYKFEAKPAHKKNDGFEGIAYNEQKKLLYVLHERAIVKSAPQAIIYTLSFDKHREVLRIVDTLLLPLGKGDFRYTDICFKNGRFMAIKSKMGEYFINDFDFENETISKSGYAKTDLTESMKRVMIANNEYSSNLEGITMDENDNIYLNSDNIQSNSCQDEPKKLTLLLKVK